VGILDLLAGKRIKADKRTFLIDRGS